jgi:hypothetical protein
MYYCGEGMAKDMNRAAGLFKFSSAPVTPAVPAVAWISA